MTGAGAPFAVRRTPSPSQTSPSVYHPPTSTSPASAPIAHASASIDLPSPSMTQASPFILPRNTRWHAPQHRLLSLHGRFAETQTRLHRAHPRRHTPQPRPHHPHTRYPHTHPPSHPTQPRFPRHHCPPHWTQPRRRRRTADDRGDTVECTDHIVDQQLDTAHGTTFHAWHVGRDLPSRRLGSGAQARPHTSSP
jgi:hypothetical protein